MFLKKCMNCKKEFKVTHNFKWKRFCPECREIEGLCGKYYTKYRALQIISGKNTPFCISCGEKNLRVLTLNHIKGKKDKTEHSTNNYPKIIRMDEAGRKGSIELLRKKFDVRCWNCNYRYEFERNKHFFPDLNVFKEYVKMRRKRKFRQPSSAIGEKVIPKSFGNINCPHKDLPTYAGGKCEKCYRKDYYENNKEQVKKWQKDYRFRKKAEKDHPIY
jgi:hypothetical protein